MREFATSFASQMHEEQSQIPPFIEQAMEEYRARKELEGQDLSYSDGFGSDHPMYLLTPDQLVR